MRTITPRFCVIAIAVASCVSVAVAGATPGWYVEGSLAASPAYAVGATYGGTTFGYFGGNDPLYCSKDLAPSEGYVVSYAKLPAGTGGQRAQLTWSAATGPLGTVYLMQLGDNGFECAPINETQHAASPAQVQLHAKASWVRVISDTSVDLKWRLEGV